MSLLLALMLSAPTLTPGTATADGDKPPKVICKTHVVSGSFLRKRRVCWTRAEWNRITEYQRDEARDLVDRSRGNLNR